MLLLVGTCTDGEGVEAASTYVQPLLSAAGWPTDDAELAIRGRPLRTFFESYTPRLSEIDVSIEDPRLAGGWLDAPTAGEDPAKFDRVQSRIEETVVTVAAEQSLIVA